MIPNVVCSSCLQDSELALASWYSSMIFVVYVRHSRLLLMVSGQRILSILPRQLFINTCTFSMMMIGVVLELSDLYSRTVSTLVIKILTLMLVNSCLQFHMFFNFKNANLTLSILATASASEPPCSVMILSMYMKVSSSSRVFPSCVIGLMFSMFYLVIMLFLVLYVEASVCSFSRVTAGPAQIRRNRHEVSNSVPLKLAWQKTADHNNNNIKLIMSQTN